MGRRPRTAKLPPAPKPIPPPHDARHTVTMRLPSDAHETLRELSYVLRRTKSSLLIEGLNSVFKQHGKPPIPVP